MDVEGMLVNAEKQAQVVIDQMEREGNPVPEWAIEQKDQAAQVLRIFREGGKWRIALNRSIALDEATKAEREAYFAKYPS